MKKSLFILILICSLSANFVFAESDKSTGLIPGSIWYSEEPLVDGKSVKIYTAIWNGDSEPLSAKVEFYDKSVVLGTRDVVVEKESLKDVYITWKVTSGDHLISAKITSSSQNTGGQSEKIVLDRVSTTADKVFVPVSIKDVNGNPASTSDAFKSQVNKAKDDIKSAIPESVSAPITNSFSDLDAMRARIDEKIDVSKVETKNEIAVIKDKSETKDQKGSVDSKPLDASEKPIAYIKLFLLSLVGFIFGSKIVFYGLILLIAFLIIRWIYRKIRNR